MSQTDLARFWQVQLAFFLGSSMKLNEVQSSSMQLKHVEKTFNTPTIWTVRALRCIPETQYSSMQLNATQYSSMQMNTTQYTSCLLYTSDAADE